MGIELQGRDREFVSLVTGSNPTWVHPKGGKFGTKIPIIEGKKAGIQDLQRLPLETRS